MNAVNVISMLLVVENGDEGSDQVAGGLPPPPPSGYTVGETLTESGSQNKG